ncbi:MAG: Asp-tRNA(Asn)/Glu-tRNA(Gln) amidotransferase subunit GatA [Chitinispirillaceae bacterium]|nr:Asp-tRNA(Asn)/Glu-tRNA(Gln) amidotransferase subunit GatA [Chitinispirillaceae bacterium]
MRFFTSTISSAALEMAAGEKKCLDITMRALESIRKSNGRLNAFISVQEENALKRAESLDAMAPSDRKQRPLFGIPIGVKDNICTKGIPTTCGSKMLEPFIPPYNATVVEALTAAGAVIVGKTNLDEFAMGSSTESSAFGVTRNPADPDRIPGGSSGGSAAAVAAALVPAALGSDTGGSIRQPCSHCGCAGLKPTYGRVSRYGLVAFASSLDQIGPMASDVRDLGTLLEVLSVPDTRDSTNSRIPFTDDPHLYQDAITGLTIGLPREYFGEGVSESVRKVCATLIDGLKARGAKIVAISLPNVCFAVATYYIICTAEASSNLARYDGVKYGLRVEHAQSLLDMYSRTREQGFGAEVKRRIMIGTYVLSSGYYDAYYLKAAKLRTLIAHDFDRAFAACDIIMSPVSPIPAFKLGEKVSDPLQMYLTDIYTVSANLAGIPGISIPAGIADGLPVGVQFMAPKWHEATLLRAGYAAQLAGT